MWSIYVLAQLEMAWVEILNLSASLHAALGALRF